MNETAMALHSSNFMPHGFCYLWTPWLLWTNVLADGLIALAYYSIPLALLQLVRRRHDLQFSWVFVLFSLFIFACGTTHVLSIWTIWVPDYPLDASVKVVTAAASLSTAILLWPLLPRALSLPSPAQLQLALAEREREILERQRAEAALAAANESLERRVAERTAALQLAEQRLQRLLSDERDARVEAERIGRMKDEFLLTLSHELRTPLSAIFGWTQMLKRTEDPRVREQAVEVIDRNVRVQTQLIEDLLDMSAIVAGRIRLEVQPVDLAATVRLAAESVRPAAEAKGIRLEQIIDPSAGPVSGDPARLQQIVWNLLSNAAKFTPKGGRITVVLERVNSHVEIRISDTGEGISADFLPLIFDRFSQADASSRRKHAGVGLGLSIVRSLVEAHGGTVQARSAGLGQGSTFSVHLPTRVLDDAESQRVPPRGTPAAGESSLGRDTWPSLSGVAVLVVDDEKDARELLQAILQERGASVRTAASAAQARSLIAEQAPQVILCDIGMPEEDGYDFVASLRQQSILVPALALTAFARAEDRVRALRAGFAAHLAKPVEPAELLVSVASLVGLYAR
jgi:signal transduction histidine kinase